MKKDVMHVTKLVFYPGNKNNYLKNRLIYKT